MEPGKASSLADLVSAVSKLVPFSNAELDVLIVGYLQKDRCAIVYPGCTSCKRKVNLVEAIVKCNNQKYMRMEQIVDMGGAKIKKNIPIITPVEDDDNCFEVSADVFPI
ncbi:hypothetical protein R1sor_006992 [Riccia sorocarpa]|uniref:Uncharacterized protein n=1 Tax=Riccia sorocarpa TaxID=122646 RepID=A0ABD3HTA6_9MARC